jgi:hypothetical protein
MVVFVDPSLEAGGPGSGAKAMWIDKATAQGSRRRHHRARNPSVDARIVVAGGPAVLA